MRMLTASGSTLVILCTVLLAGPPALAAPSRATAKAELSFRTAAGAEPIVSVSASSPGSRWDNGAAEAAIATVYLDDDYNQDIAVDHGSAPFTYQIFLGPLRAGEHRLVIERNNRWSAPDAPLEVQKIAVRSISAADPDYAAVAHAPILYARADTVGHFSDVPLLAWYEVFPDGGGEEIQYSYVFSNEDAGTPPAALMARWGRTTDIEYAYRVWLDREGKIQRETFQGFSHQNTSFRGHKGGEHPYILVATPNNVFADTGASEMQYHLLPVRADLSQHSREELMDRFPWTYQIMAEELKREDKLRPFGEWTLATVSDPRNYLYFELNSRNENAGLNVWVKVKGSARLYSSDGGYRQLAIWRSGWFRTTVELPPRTEAGSIQEIGLECIAGPELNSGEAGAGPSQCQVQDVSKAFLLGPDYIPGISIFETHTPMILKPGKIYLLVPNRARVANSSS
jgi:hypothetical protein